VRVKWDNVPAPGHYCLLARWVSQGDPMTFPELLGLNTVTNTQENNNIGWRNVNIVNALPGGHTGGGVVMADADGLPAVLAIEPRLPFPGKILLDLGPELFARWKAAGGEARGVEHYKDSTLVVSPEGGKLYGLPLKEGGTDRLEVTFEVSGDASPGVREVLFRQLGSDGKKDFGGVRWDINVLSPDAPAVATTVEATRNTKKLVELTWPHTVHHKAYRIWRLDAGDASKKGARAGKGAGEPIATIDAGEAVETTAVRFIDPDSAGRAGVYTVESISQAGDSAFSEPVASDPTFNR
jgi:hypothetical protein